MRSLALCLCLAACGAPEPEPAATTLSREIIGGEPYTGHPAVGRLYVGSDATCTATLIGTRTALTSAHCVPDAGELYFALIRRADRRGASITRYSEARLLHAGRFVSGRAATGATRRCRAYPSRQSLPPRMPVIIGYGRALASARRRGVQCQNGESSVGAEHHRAARAHELTIVGGLAWATRGLILAAVDGRSA